MHPGHPGQRNYNGSIHQDLMNQDIDSHYPADVDPVLLEEERMKAEENIYNTHLDAVKEEV